MALPFDRELPKAVEHPPHLVQQRAANGRGKTAGEGRLPGAVIGHLNASHRPIHTRSQCGHRIADAPAQHVVAVAVHRAVAVAGAEPIAEGIDRVAILLAGAGRSRARIRVAQARQQVIRVDGAAAGGAGLVEVFMHL